MSLIAVKESDQAPLSRFGGHCVDCKRPGLRAGGKELAQRLLFTKDSEDADLTQKGAKNTQSVSASRFCQEINSQKKASSTQ